MSDYRLEIRVKNAHLYRAIMSRHRSVAEFCRLFGYKQQTVCSWLALRTVPFSTMVNGRRSWNPGMYKESAKRIAEDLGENVEDLFPPRLYIRIFQRALIVEANMPALPASTVRALIGEVPRLNDGMKDAIDQQLQTLRPREAKIIRERFGIDTEPETLEKIGLEFNLSKERICQIEAKGLRMLRHPGRSKKLSDYMFGDNT